MAAPRPKRDLLASVTASSKSRTLMTGATGPNISDFRIAISQFSVGLGLLDLGFPRQAAQAAAEVYAAHGRAIAEELTELFNTMVWPAYRQSGASPGTIQEVVERLKPLSVASLVSAYEQAMDDTKRAEIERRTARGDRRSG